MNHPKIPELLPWYVNGTLDVGDRQAAALEVASCDECAADVEALTKLQAAMLELETQAPEPSEYAFTRALAAVEEEERKKRLGHPWFGWWWSLNPFRRAIVVSSALGAAVMAGIIIAPKPVAHVSEAPLSATPITLEAFRPNTTADTYVVGRTEAAPVAKTLAANVPALSAAIPAKIARTGGVNLLVSDVEAAIASITSAAHAQGGEIVSLNDETPSQPGVRHTAQIQVNVPESRFDATIAAFAKLGGLKSRTVSAEDVGGQIVDAGARLHNLRTTEADLLKIMDRSGKIDEVLQVENQVSATREQIEELDGQLSALKQRVAMSTITVDLEDQAPSPAVDISFAAQLRDAWTSALRSVKAFTIALVGGLLWGVAYSPYIAAVVLIGGLAALRWRRA